MVSPPLPRHAPSHRLFLAIAPPPILARQVAQSARWFGSEGGSARADRLHVTLDILDDFDVFPEQEAEALGAAMSAIAVAPVEVAFDQAVGSTRSVALRSRRSNPSLARLHHAICLARADAGLPQRTGYRFSPHMTLFYRGGAPFSRAITPIGWMAQEFVLIHSLVGRTQHKVLGRWPLRGADDGQYRLV